MKGRTTTARGCEELRVYVKALEAAILVELAEQKLSMYRVAASVGITVRTLQRRLAGAGTTYSRLLQAVRRDEACRVLRETNLPISAVAAMLGYSEPSAFSRAFHRWCGMSPRRFRTKYARPATDKDKGG